MSDPQGRTTVGLYGGARSSGGIDGGYSLFYDIAERRRIYLGTTNDGGAALHLFDANENTLVSIGAIGKGGQIVLNGKQVQDYAEVLELTSRKGVIRGSVMAVDGPKGIVGLSSAPYDRRVVGVISGAGGLQPGSVIGSREDGTNDLPVAVSGQVYVRANLEGGAIEPGDLLVASSRPGVSMRAADLNRTQGAVIGKAMEAFASTSGGEGLVRMMVMLR